jgi:DNA-binding NarL/FixJ family response regulator
MTAALNLVRAGGFYVPYEVLGYDWLASTGKTGGLTAATQFGLTERQLEVLQLIQKGYNNRKIAQQLQISESTVKQHLHTMFGTLRVSSRTEAIAAAIRLGFRQQ